MKISAIFLVFAILLTSGLMAAKEEGKLKRSDVPEVVLKAFEKVCPDAEATNFSREFVEGQARYGIETEVAGFEKDYTFLADGTLLQKDEDILVQSLSDKIVESIMKAYPEGEINEADKITRDTTVEFNVVVAVGDIDYELRVSTEGIILYSIQLVEDEDGPSDIDKDNDDEMEKD